jgi:hypothetical protein
MNKTIYIRDEDVPIWERAKELAGDKLSPAIVAGLKRFIADREAEEAEAKGFERIEVSFNDADDHHIPKKKAFYGKWIYPPEHKEVFKQHDEDGENWWYYAVAMTAKGSVVVYSWESDREGMGNYRFDIFPSLVFAAADNRVNSAITATIRKIGVPVEELDI